MTLDKFLEFKADIEKGLQRALDLYEKTGILRNCVATTKTKQVGVPKGRHDSYYNKKYETGKAHFTMQDQVRLQRQGYDIKIKAETIASGRYDMVDYIYLVGTKKVVIDSERDFRRRVKSRMHTILRKYIGKELNAYVSDINCSVMDMFKAGDIGWEQVVKAHDPNCEF